MDKIYRKLNKITVIAMLVLCMTFLVASFTYAYYYDDEDYPEIYSAYWENRTARWDTIGYASKYELRLYRNGHQIITKSTSRDFRSLLPSLFFVLRVTCPTSTEYPRNFSSL